MANESVYAAPAIEGDIQKARTAQTLLAIRDADGHPLVHQEVTLAQTSHQFLFGCAGMDILSANDAKTGAEKDLAQRRLEALAGLFNFVTLPFYWGRFEPERGRPMTAPLRGAAQWCADRGLRLKGHPLCWHTLTADWLRGLSNKEILAAQVARIHREVTDFRGLIDMWDVLNEGVIMPIFDKYENGITRICKELGRLRTIRTMFAAAREANPSAMLLLNDFDMSPAYDILVEGCLEAGIPIDVIGIQSHMHQGYWGVEKTLRVLEQFSRFGLPIHFTETTLVSGHLMPPEIVDLNDYQVADWPTTPEGEERQARETILHYETLLAHPLVAGITWWDLADGGWLKAPAGLIRKDASRKPAYEELRQRIRGEWWMPPTVLGTDDLGCVRFSGWLGDYTVSARGVTRAISLSARGAQQLSVAL